MSRILAWTCAVETVVMTTLEYGLLGLLASSGMLGVLVWRRWRPSVTALLVACTVMGAVGPMGPAGGVRVPALTQDGVLSPGDPFHGTCRPVLGQSYGPTDFKGEPVINGQLVHTGVDLDCRAGTPIYTLSSGTAHVTTGWYPGSSIGGGFGNNVVVEVGNGFFVRYGHMQRVVVADGTVLRAGDQLGEVGCTGFCTGPHLHFEIDVGKADVYHAIDPTHYLAVTWR